MGKYFDRLRAMGLDRLEGSFPEVSAVSLLDFERALGESVDADYRAFVLDFAFCSFEKQVTFGVEEDGGRHEVAVFYGPGSARGYGLEEALSQYRKRLPKAMFPIAEVPGGDQICLGVNKQAGRVFLWEHEQELRSNRALGAASSFDAFVRSFREEGSDDDAKGGPELIDFSLKF